MKRKLTLIEKLILFAIFVSPLRDTFIVNIGIINFKLPQIVWAIIFLLALIESSQKKCTISEISGSEKNNYLVFAIYLCLISISCLFSIDLRQSLKELIQYVYLFFAMYFIYVKAKDKDFFELVIKVLIISNAFIVSIALISIIVGKQLVPSVMISNMGISINSDLYNSQMLYDSETIIERINILGMGPIGITYYILLQSLLVNYKIRVTTGKTKVLLVLLLLANAGIIILGYSRVGILLFSSLHIFTLFSKKKIRNFGIISAAIIGAYIFLLLFPNIFQRISETFNTQEESTRYHFVFWLIALKTGYNNFLTGIGIGNMEYTPGNNDALFDSFGLYRTDIVPTHNFILQIWSEQGMGGLLINIILLGLPIIYYINARFIRKTISSKAVFNYIVLAYVGSLIYSLTNNSFYIEMCWGYLGVMYAMKCHLVRDGDLLLGKYI